MSHATKGVWHWLARKDGTGQVGLIAILDGARYRWHCMSVCPPLLHRLASVAMKQRGMAYAAPGPVYPKSYG